MVIVFMIEDEIEIGLDTKLTILPQCEIRALLCFSLCN